MSSPSSNGLPSDTTVLDRSAMSTIQPVIITADHDVLLGFYTQLFGAEEIFRVPAAGPDRSRRRAQPGRLAHDDGLPHLPRHAAGPRIAAGGPGRPPGARRGPRPRFRELPGTRGSAGGLGRPRPSGGAGQVGPRRA